MTAAPVRYRIAISPRAQRDFAALWSRVARDSEQAASDLVEQLWGAAFSLETFPLRHPVYRRRRVGGVVVRSLTLLNQRILYCVEGRTVQVLTVRHAARRVPRRLKPD